MEDSYYISEFNLRGYKSIIDVTGEFKEGLNIIIGPNNSGKSNLLNYLFSVAFFNFLDSELSGFNLKFNLKYNSLHQRETFYTMKYSKKETLFENKKDSLIEILIEKNLNGKVIALREKVTNLADSFRLKFKIYDKFSEIYLFPSFVRFSLDRKVNFLSEPQGYTFDIKSKSIGGQSSQVGIFRYLEIYDEFLKLFLPSIILNEKNVKNKVTYIKKRIKESFLSYFKLVIKNLHTFTPIKGVRINESLNIHIGSTNILISNLILEFKVNKEWVPWTFLSDGTRRIFYLISEVTLYDKGIVFIEEPELGVHPDQFYKIMEFLNEEAKVKQIIISTHSPQALNIINPDELDRITISKMSTKGTTLLKMTKPQVKKARSYIKNVGSLSDFWLHSTLEQS